MRRSCSPLGFDTRLQADKSRCRPTPGQAYTVVAPQVAAFPAYRRTLAETLLRVKLRHWDPSLRGLAAQALALLVPPLSSNCKLACRLTSSLRSN